MSDLTPAEELRTAAATLLAGKPEHSATFADEYPDLDAALAGVLNMQATGLEYDPDWNGVELPAALATARRINAGESAWALADPQLRDRLKGLRAVMTAPLSTDEETTDAH